MTDLLRAIGAALYGADWVAPMAHDLGVAPRNVRRWAGGALAVPAGVWADLRKLIRARQDLLVDLDARIPL